MRRSQNSCRHPGGGDSAACWPWHCGTRQGGLGEVGTCTGALYSWMATTLPAGVGAQNAVCDAPWLLGEGCMSDC